MSEANSNKTIVERLELLAGRFEVLEALGEGAAGCVYRVLDLKQNRKQVALKVLINTQAFDEHTYQRFLDEFTVCQRIAHQNIVRAYDVIRLEHGVAFTMEYVKGRDLSKIIRVEKLRFDEIDRLFMQICSAVSELHRNSIVHRDLKLENILLTDNGEVKLVDLGLMKRLDQDKSLTRSGILLGTAQYMPPEYIKTGTYDYRSDIYALGLILYEILSGERKLAKLRGVDAIDHLMKTNFEIPKLTSRDGVPIPAKYQDILDQALDPRPARRFQSADQMKSAFNQSAINSGTKSTTNSDTATLTLRSSRAPGRNFPRWPVAFAAGILTVATATLGIPYLGLMSQWERVSLGSYEGELLLGTDTKKSSVTNGITTRRFSVEVSQKGVFVILNMPKCKSGFLNASNGEIICPEGGKVRVDLQNVSSTAIVGNVTNGEGNGSFPFLAKKVDRD